MAFNGIARALCVNPQFPTDQVLRVQVTQDNGRVGERRLVTTQTVAGRPRHRAGALGTNLDRPRRINRHNTSATGTDLRYVNERQLDRVPPSLDQLGADIDTGADLVFGGPRGLTVFHHGRLGRCAAHVE